MGVFKDKTLMITGGTGSFGNAVLDKFLCSDVREIRIFSRDEKKQDDMRHEYQAKYPEQSEKIKFYIGDVRDIGSVRNAMHDVDYLFHAAALKQVPSCEFFPIEAVKTNCSSRSRCQKDCVSVYRQSGISGKCHGNIQGYDGKSNYCKVKDNITGENADQLYKVWECFVLPGICCTAVHQSD